MPRKPVKYIIAQPAIHLSCAYLMSRSPSCTGKTHELFARLQEDLALQKFLIRLSTTVFGRHMALLLSDCLGLLRRFVVGSLWWLSRTKKYDSTVFEPVLLMDWAGFGKFLLSRSSSTKSCFFLSTLMSSYALVRLVRHCQFLYRIMIIILQA
jgi:hypothetical protein